MLKHLLYIASYRINSCQQTNSTIVTTTYNFLWWQHNRQNSNKQTTNLIFFKARKDELDTTFMCLHVSLHAPTADGGDKKSGHKNTATWHRQWASQCRCLAAGAALLYVHLIAVAAAAAVTAESPWNLQPLADLLALPGRTHQGTVRSPWLVHCCYPCQNPTVLGSAFPTSPHDICGCVASGCLPWWTLPHRNKDVSFSFPHTIQQCFRHYHQLTVQKLKCITKS